MMLLVIEFEVLTVLVTCTIQLLVELTPSTLFAFDVTATW